MASSQAATVRKALQGMGLIGNGVAPALSEKRREAARLGNLRKKELREAAKNAKNPDKSGEQTASAPSLPASFAGTSGDSQMVANTQTAQQANALTARQILSDAAPRAAKYLSDLVSGAIPDVPERVKLEAAKVILTSQGVTGEQSGNSRQDVNSMSKADLLAFIQAGSVELKRLQAEREAQVIDVTPSESDM